LRLRQDPAGKAALMPWQGNRPTAIHDLDHPDDAAPVERARELDPMTLLDRPIPLSPAAPINPA
jgi:hypothetical protein